MSSGDLDNNNNHDNNNNNNNTNNNNCNNNNNYNYNYNNTNNINNDDDDDDDLGQLCIPYLNAYWKCNPSLCGKCFHGHSRTIEAFFTNAKDMLRTCMLRSPQIHSDMQATAILKSTPNGQTCQLSRFHRETHGLGYQLTISRFGLQISR